MSAATARNSSKVGVFRIGFFAFLIFNSAAGRVDDQPIRDRQRKGISHEHRVQVARWHPNLSLASQVAICGVISFEMRSE